MKLVSYGPAGAEQPGVFLEEEARIVPLSPLWAQLGQPPPDMCAVVGLLPWLRDAIEEELAASDAGFDGAGVRLGPPVPRPSKVVVCGLNTRSQLEEAQAFFGELAPRRPPLALRPPTNLAGPHDVIVRPSEAEGLDYEAELAVVIGRAARRVGREQAGRHIAGYMCAQDLTSAALLRADTDISPLFLQPTHAKGVDTFCPTGPWLVTADEVVDPAALSIRTWVNDEMRQDGSTSELIVGVSELIEWLSATFALLPGDIILTGTPAGMGGALDPPQELRHGDVVRTAIAGLGEMVNRVEEIR
ncbi:MAG TPA: fumarylacetoacetate hydrolase family protein [Solirubrobacteraceae bacterium]|jgi:2-keto-4-pentenoate hydratase/2-oxohepta-3-ene-1,7-dioic acid hydratase in catechol pathway